jgi:glycosyltransferase involved in cell wall biosynthesis
LGLHGLRRDLGSILKDNKIPLVHTHASFSGRLAAKTLRTPFIVYTKHRQDWDPGRGWARKQAIARLNRFTCHHAIAVSEGVKRDLIAGGLPAKMITVIYNGVDGDKINGLAVQDPEDFLTEYADKRVVGMVARLEPEKGHRYFLEAAAQVLNEHPDVLFLIVGAGSLADSLPKLAASLGISDKIVFTGYRKNVAKLINMMDILVIPSLTEAFGITMVEGMCLGKPCVASAVGGLTEIAGADGDVAFLVPPGDAESLASKIRYLLENPETARVMGKQGAKIAAAKFSAEKMTDEITELYYRLLGDVSNVGY